MVTGLAYTHDPNFGSLSQFWRCKEHPCPLNPHLWLWRTLEALDWGLASWSGYVHWSLIHPWSKFWLSILTLKVQRTSMSFKSSFGALEDDGGSWLGFGIFRFDYGTDLWYNHDLNFGSLNWFLRYKEHPYPLSPHLELWRILEVSDWASEFWSWFGYGHWSLVHQFS